MRALKITLFVLFTLAATGVLALIVFPGPFIESATKIASEKLPLKFSRLNVSGNLVTGLVIRDLRLNAPQANITVERARISFEWLKLLHRTFAIDTLDIERPRVTLSTSTATASESDKTRSRWMLIANRVTITDGQVRLPPNGEKPATQIDGIQLALSYEPNKINIFSSQATVGGTTVSARGQVGLAPLNVDASGMSRGVVNGQFTVSGSTSVARATIHAAMAKGPRFTANLNMDHGRAHWSALIAEGGIDAKANGTFDTGSRALTLAWNAAVSSDTFRQWTNTEASVAGTGTARGTWPLVRWNVHATFAGYRMNPTQVVDGAVDATGTMQSHRITLALKSTDYALRAAGAGRYENSAWDMTWTKFDLRAVQEWSLVKPFATRVTKKQARVTGFKMADPSVPLQIDLDAQMRFAQKEIALERLRLKTADGQAVASGSIQLPSKSTKTPQFTLRLVSTNLDPTPVLKGSPVQTKAARLNAAVRIEKQGAQLTMSGPITLVAQQIDVPEQGIHLQDAVFKMVGSGTTLKITEGTALSKKKGHVTVTGSINASNLDIRVQAKNVGFDSERGISGRTDADLALTGSVDEPRINGDIYVLGANITPPKKKKEKEKTLPAATRAEPPSALAMRLRIHFDRDVWYKEKQSSIEAKGDLEIKKPPYGAALISGTIETVRGDYVFYGRTFKIDHGRALFTGEPGVNPTLDLQAVYTEKQSKTAITLTVSGTLDDPRLSLTSDPPLEQTDIISVLVTGHPMDDPNRSSDSNAQNAAKATVANYFAEQIRERVQSTAQIDVLQFNVKDTEETDIVVGKNVSDRLYLAYGQTLGPNGEQRVEAEYSLGHFWSLVGYTATEGKYVIDLIYRLGLK